VYIDSISAFAGHSNGHGKPEGVFNDSGVASDTLDRSFGFKMGSNRRQTLLRKTLNKAKQKSDNGTTVSVLKRRQVFEK
jgi:hypothetical protein